MLIGNFGGNFWSTFRGFQGPRPIEEKLDREDVSLEEILDDDDVIQELKMTNQKLLDFFTPARLSDLLDFITEMPSEMATHSQAHKFPFVVSELISCEIHDFLDRLYESALLRKLISFYTKSPLNVTLAGYVQKALVALLKRNSKAVITTMTSLNALPCIFSHLQFQAVADLVDNIVNLDTDRENFLEFLMQRQFALQASVMALGSPRTACNAMGILLHLAENQDISGWRILLKELFRSENIRFIVQNLHGKDKNVIKYSACFLKSVFKSDRKDDILQAIDLNILKDEMANEISGVVRELRSTSEEFLMNTLGKETEVLGEHRLYIADLLAETVRLQLINSSLASADLSDTLVKLFFKHEWNSAFQHVFENYVLAVLSSDSEELRINLLNTDLLYNMIECKAFPGLSGHIRKIGNELCKLSETIEDLQEALCSCGGWGKFRKEFLEVRNKIEARHLGGGNMDKEQDKSLSEDDFHFDSGIGLSKDDDIDEDLDKELEEPLTFNDLQPLKFENKGNATNRYDPEEESDITDFYGASYWKIQHDETELENLD